MNKKISLGLCISLIIIAVAATFAATMVVSKQIFSNIISNISQRSQTYESVDEISKIISNYYYGSVDDQSKLNASLAEGYVNGLSEGSNIYLSSAEYSAYTAKLEGGVSGIGVETAYNYQTGQFVITYVYEGSPAEKAGLKAKDAITAIDNTAVTMSNYISMRDLLYGSRLSTVTVEYERNGETKVVEPMLGFSIPSVSSRLIGNVGYIKISGFYKNTAAEFKAAAEKLIEQGAESMIFDVRNTSDGSIDYAARTIDVIVPAISDNIAVAKDKNGNVYKKKIYTAENSSITMPFIVLINNYTSGPAELFACDLRDISQAQLVGTKTAGIGTMQELFPLEDGGAVLLTVALIEPRAGEAAVYDGVGIEPTVEVTLNSGDPLNIDLLAQDEDNQLSTAVNMLAA
ncbi:MAG: S41 family peptidase [Oscillospiraceae bacterium]|nr:S41 family peptidase [Clostridiaceae bacterium]MDY5949216.1 S41 family peptidase [Oscillospiraceae bacterium]